MTENAPAWIETSVPGLSAPLKLAGLGLLPVTLIGKSAATLLPPSSFTTCLITRRVPSGCTASKHSVVRFVWWPGEYCANRSGVYSARKQYLPGSVGVYGAEVAWPPLSIAEPSPLPPLEQSGLETIAGPQTKKATLPLTGPFGPASVARSVTDWPTAIDVALAWVVKVAGTGATDAAASERSMLPRPSLSRSRSRMW